MSNRPENELDEVALYFGNLGLLCDRLEAENKALEARVVALEAQVSLAKAPGVAVPTESALARAIRALAAKRTPPGEP